MGEGLSTATKPLVFVISSDFLFSWNMLRKVVASRAVALVILVPGFANIGRIRQALAMLWMKDFALIPFFLLTNVASLIYLRLKRLRLIRCDSVNSIEVRNLIAMHEEAHVVNFNGSEIWTEATLQSTKYPLNIHFGRLPQYRGLSPMIHALRNGDTSLEVNLHLMSAESDRGPVAASERILATEGSSLLGLHAQLSGVSANLCINLMDELAFARGCIVSETYFKAATRDEVKEASRALKMLKRNSKAKFSNKHKFQ